MFFVYIRLCDIIEALDLDLCTHHWHKPTVLQATPSISSPTGRKECVLSFKSQPAIQAATTTQCNKMKLHNDIIIHHFLLSFKSICLSMLVNDWSKYECAQLKLSNIWVIFPNFQNCVNIWHSLKLAVHTLSKLFASQNGQCPLTNILAYFQAKWRTMSTCTCIYPPRCAYM